MIKLSEDVDKEGKRAFLNQLPDVKGTARTLQNMIKIQHAILKKLEASLLADDVARLDRDHWDRNFRMNKTFRNRLWNSW